jgi:DNA modification methylase
VEIVHQNKLFKILFNDNKADMIFTDPPYNVDYMSTGREKKDRFEVRLKMTICQKMNL